MITPSFYFSYNVEIIELSIPVQVRFGIEVNSPLKVPSSTFSPKILICVNFQTTPFTIGKSSNFPLVCNPECAIVFKSFHNGSENKCTNCK
jgi:hypothetical protein